MILLRILIVGSLACSVSLKASAPQKASTESVYEKWKAILEDDRGVHPQYQEQESTTRFHASSLAFQEECMLLAQKQLLATQKLEQTSDLTNQLIMRLLGINPAPAPAATTNNAATAASPTPAGNPNQQAPDHKTNAQK